VQVRVKQTELPREREVAESDMTTLTDDTQHTLILSESAKNDIVTRLRRIEGQARGVQRMVEEGRPCEDIIIQVAALKAAVTQAGVAIAGSHLVECVAYSIASGEANCRNRIAGFARLFSKLA
jgi:DNA-binding FrmR family transcriptional regulator